MSDDDAKVTKTEQEWREQLSAHQYHITREKGTERPFTGEYNDCKRDGVYRCACCDAPLFSSEAKFDSGSGWPSFFRPLQAEGIDSEEDHSFGMTRVEVMCAKCEAHLGHVFPDGPAPTGLRYCVNSASLRLDEEG